MTYKFEIWWNTGDWYWDNEPDIEFFNGTIDQLNDYINDKVRSMELEHIGWDEELADINEEDIEELTSTGSLQKCEDNVVWMLRSAEESKMRVKEGMFGPKPWSARGIEKAKAKKESPRVSATPHKYSVHMANLNTEQLFRLMAANNMNKGIELFGFGLVKIKGRFYLYEWNPLEYRPTLNFSAYRLSTDFTDDMADDLGHWIKNKEMMGISSGRVWPIYASGVESSGYAKYEGIMVFGNDKSSVNKYKKMYDKLIHSRDALPIEHGNTYSGDVTEFPGKFNMGSWLSVDLDPDEIMSLGVGQRDIFDDTEGKSYGEVTPEDLHESEDFDGDIKEGDTAYICQAGTILKDKPLKVLKVYWGRNQEMMMAKTQLPSGAIRHYPACWLWKEKGTIQESEKSFPGLNRYMKKDVENIFNHNPDMSMDYFLNSVCGEGDEGYDSECAAIMWEYYEYLQSR